MHKINNSNTIYFILEQGGGGLVTQLRKSYSLTDLDSTPENDESSNFDAQMQRRALPQITDVTGTFQQYI